MAKTRKPKYTTVAPELNEVQAAFSAKLKKLEDAVKKAKEKYYDTQHECVHAIGYTIDHQFGDDEGDAYCVICEKHFGHYCPESPDHTCHYYTVLDGKIKLFTGEIIDPPVGADGEPHDPDYETSDCCIFCGAPEERK